MHAFTQADALLVQIGKAQANVDVTTFLVRDLHLPEAYIQLLIRSKRVRIGKQPVDAHACLQTGQVLRLQGDVLRTRETFEEDTSLVVNLPLVNDDYHSLDILYEDPHLLVVNKPAGVLIHADGNESSTSNHNIHTLLEMVMSHYNLQDEPYAVRHIHRLDRPTTGTVLFAKHGYSTRALDNQLANRHIHRRYLAVVYGKQILRKKGTITQPIGRDRHQSGKYRVSVTGKPAVTHYETLQTIRWNDGYLSLVQCELTTGRTHQIRVHLAHLGCPIVSDVLYGGYGFADLGLPTEQIALHAHTLSFEHPYEQQTITVVASIPKNWYIFNHETGLKVPVN